MPLSMKSKNCIDHTRQGSVEQWFASEYLVALLDEAGVDFKTFPLNNSHSLGTGSSSFLGVQIESSASNKRGVVNEFILVESPLNNFALQRLSGEGQCDGFDKDAARFELDFSADLTKSFPIPPVFRQNLYNSELSEERANALVILDIEPDLNSVRELLEKLKPCLQRIRLFIMSDTGRLDSRLRGVLQSTDCAFSVAPRPGTYRDMRNLLRQIDVAIDVSHEISRVLKNELLAHGVPLFGTLVNATDLEAAIGPEANQNERRQLRNRVRAGDGFEEQVASLCRFIGRRFAPRPLWQRSRAHLPSAHRQSIIDLTSLQQKNVVFAGHDFKFASELINTTGRLANVQLDQWSGHAKHDARKSRKLLKYADVIFCEWGLGNLKWYSKRLKSHQKLYVRIHSQEFKLPFIDSADLDNVDGFIFVSQLFRQIAIDRWGIPAEKAYVIPNYVKNSRLQRAPECFASRIDSFGMIGYVPELKRLDRAISILEMRDFLRKGCSLHIKGKPPTEYGWMASKNEQSEYYSKQFARAKELNSRAEGAVVFDDFSDDTESWYSSMGFVLSVSEYESFHLAVAEGAALGAVPCLLDWPGADLIYPSEWLYRSLEDLAAGIEGIRESGRADKHSEEVQSWVRQHLSEDTTIREIVDLVLF